MLVKHGSECRSFKLKTFYKNLTVTLFVGLSFVLIGCGQQTGSNKAIPQVQDPDDKAKQPLNIPGTQVPDARLPDITRAVGINLTDKTNFLGLKDLASDFALPLVGDPGISMAYTSSAKPDGSVLLYFEDKLGFWGAALPSFAGTTSKTSTSFEMIFADSELVVRTTATLVGDQLDGTIYYRLKKSGETACVKQTTTCDIINPGQNWGNFTCPYPQPDTATPCIQYMNTANPDVKNLGKFKSKYSQWATLAEGN